MVSSKNAFRHPAFRQAVGPLVIFLRHVILAPGGERGVRLPGFLGKLIPVRLVDRK